MGVRLSHLRLSSRAWTRLLDVGHSAYKSVYCNLCGVSRALCTNESPSSRYPHYGPHLFDNFTLSFAFIVSAVYCASVFNWLTLSGVAHACVVIPSTAVFRGRSLPCHESLSQSSLASQSASSSHTMLFTHPHHSVAVLCVLDCSLQQNLSHTLSQLLTLRHSDPSEL